MISYIIKRVLLMIPTFLAISLIIFLVLNLAPGDPATASAGSDGTETVSADARESYRIFKEQFNLDKPTLINTRFMISQEDVEAQIMVLADYQRPVCAPDSPADGTCTPLAERPSSSQVIAAQEIVENWGTYIVPHLYELATTHERLGVRHLALNRLSSNARQRLIKEYGRKHSAEERALNQRLAAENNRIRRWSLPANATAEDIDAMLAENWTPWFEENRGRYEYSTTEKISIFFSDTRFFRYWANLIRLDFGVSTVDKKPVLDTIWIKLRYSVTLSFFSIFLAYFISIPLGVWSAYKQNTRADQAVTLVLFMLYSLPAFFTGILLLEFFTVGEPFQWFPTGGFVGNNPEDMTVIEYMRSVAWHIFLPVMCLTYGALASLSRYARTGLLDVIRADYIRTARAKGLSESMVIIKHAVRNGMIPILTLIGTLLPALIGGSVVLEVIFNIPGIGLYLFESIQMRDYNAIMGCLLISTVLTLVGMLISDISYSIVDPRISFK